MTTIYHDDDADLEVLRGETIAVVGYGNQGRAQAQNLRDSGLRVIVGNIRDAALEQAAAPTASRCCRSPQACARADAVMLLVPDEIMPAVYAEHVAPNLRAGALVDFASGYNVAFDLIRPAPDLDVVLVAPRMIGVGVRETYLEGSGFPSFVVRTPGRDGPGARAHARDRQGDRLDARRLHRDVDARRSLAGSLHRAGLRPGLRPRHDVGDRPARRSGLSAGGRAARALPLGRVRVLAREDPPGGDGPSDGFPLADQPVRQHHARRPLPRRSTRRSSRRWPRSSTRSAPVALRRNGRISRTRPPRCSTRCGRCARSCPTRNGRIAPARPSGSATPRTGTTDARASHFAVAPRPLPRAIRYLRDHGSGHRIRAPGAAAAARALRRRVRLLRRRRPVAARARPRRQAATSRRCRAKRPRGSDACIPRSRRISTRSSTSNRRPGARACSCARKPSGGRARSCPVPGVGSRGCAGYRARSATSAIAPLRAIVTAGSVDSMCAASPTQRSANAFTCDRLRPSGVAQA